MKATNILLSLLGGLFFIVAFSCKKETPKEAPTLTTTAATNITSGTFISGGEIKSDGGATIAAVGVCWNTDQNPTITDNKTIDVIPSGVFINLITGLNPGTSYFLRAYAINSAGTSYGNQVTATTLALLPTITTTWLSAITATSATGGGNITSDGGATVTVKGVCWSTSQNPTTALNTKTTDGSGTGSFTSILTGLTPGTTYYVRAYATNSIGTVYGNQIIPSTLTKLPEISTTSVTTITSTSAVTGGNVTNDGGATVTERGVVYATTPTPTTSNFKVVNGTGTSGFTSSFKSLTPGTIYYVRAYAINNKGTAYGNEINFKTLRINNLKAAIYNGHFYCIPTKNLNWNDAKIYSESLGGHLVVVNNQSENNFIFNLNDQVNGGLFLGLSDIVKEGEWRWADGTLCRKVELDKSNPDCAGKPKYWIGDPCIVVTDFGYNNWAAGEPNNCGGGPQNIGICMDESYALLTNDGTWNDVPNFGTFMIEWDYIPSDEILNKLFSE